MVVSNLTSFQLRKTSALRKLFQSEYLQTLTFFFYSGHCKSLAPEYAKAAATLAKLDPPQYVAKVDATENEALAQRFEVQGFPTLHFFK